MNEINCVRDFTKVLDERGVEGSLECRREIYAEHKEGLSRELGSSDTCRSTRTV
jgi:hypothetical protein